MWLYDGWCDRVKMWEYVGKLESIDMESFTLQHSISLDAGECIKMCTRERILLLGNGRRQMFGDKLFSFKT